MNDKAAPNNPLGLVDPFAQLVREVRDYAIFMLDAGGRIASWNAGAERIKGYAAADIIGQHFSVFYPEEARQRRIPDEQLQIATARGRFEDEGWRIRKDGVRFWANVVITALRDETGGLRGFAKITRDLTERRRQEEELRRSQERFRLLVEGVKDYAMFMLDREGRIASWNAGAERIKGYKAHEVVGRHFSVFYPREAIDKKWPEQELAMAREHGRFDDEVLRVRKDGSSFWADVTITPLYDQHGELLGYAKVTRDLTDRKRVEALEKAERRTNEFLAMLAHELRNPLAPISNALHLLAKKPASDPTEQWVRGVLQRQAGQMARLVDELLDVSRITRGSISLDMKPLDARNAVRTAFDASRQWMEARRHAATLQLPEEAVAVHADEARLSQVVQALLQNAAQFTPERGSIEVELRRKGHEAVIRVKDSGIGMNPELLSSAFELFKQGHQALHRPQGGLGLGLTLVQRLVGMHGGTVQAHSAGPDRGSEFTVRLPLAQVPAQEAQVEEKPAPPMAPRKVLVVDDNQDAAGALKLLLESDGHEVKIASDGMSGLALARAYKPDYVLLDIGLPRLNGYEIAASLRADAALKDLVIVAITGYGQVHDRARTAAVGFDHHLTKPVEFTTLQEIFRARA
jgi:PAS domain S-box-containing protein